MVPCVIRSISTPDRILSHRTHTSVLDNVAVGFHPETEGVRSCAVGSACFDGLRRFCRFHAPRRLPPAIRNRFPAHWCMFLACFALGASGHS